MFTGSSRRERHAKTMEVAQEEVVTCVGICLLERMQRVAQRLREEEQMVDLLQYASLQALRRSFEIAVESKRGVSQLELLCEELSREEAAQKQRKEAKKQRRKKKRGKKESSTCPGVTCRADKDHDDEDDEDENDQHPPPQPPPKQQQQQQQQWNEEEEEEEEENAPRPSRSSATTTPDTKAPAENRQKRVQSIQEVESERIKVKYSFAK